MEALIGYMVIMGGLLILATLYKPHKRKPSSQAKDGGNTPEPLGGSSHG